MQQSSGWRVGSKREGGSSPVPGWWRGWGRRRNYQGRAFKGWVGVRLAERGGRIFLKKGLEPGKKVACPGIR